MHFSSNQQKSFRNHEVSNVRIGMFTDVFNAVSKKFSVQLAMPLHQRRNVLIVEESTVEDICVSLAQEKLDEMKIFRGDVILIAGNFASETVAIAIAGEGCGFDRIRMHASIRQNLNVSVGETVSVFFCLPENGIKVQIHRSIDDALTQ